MFVSRDECLAQIGNAYILTLVAAKRARQLNAIARDKNIHQINELSLISTDSIKASKIALEEIASGKIKYYLN